MTMGRGLKRVLIAAAVVVVVIAAVVALLFRTEAGARRIIAFALGKSTAGVEIGEIRGTLSGPLHLLDVRYRSGALSAIIDSTMVDWRPTSLLGGRIRLDRVHATGLHVTLPDSAPRDTTGLVQARRERPNPPINIELGDVRVRGIEIDALDNLTVRAGSLELDGALESYRFSMTGRALLPKYPQLDTVRVRLSGTGDLERIHVARSSADVLDGRMAMVGEVRWWPQVEWNLAARGSDIRPARAMERPETLPGVVDVHGRTAGSITRNGPVGQVIIDSVGGSLRGQPVRGRGEIRFAGTVYRLVGLNLGWGSARIAAQGRVADTMTVGYRVDVADLRTVLPVAKGALSVRGTARGPRLTPEIDASLTGSGLGYATATTARVSGRARVGLAPDGRTEIDLRGEGGRIGPRDIGRMVIAVRGVRPRHRLTAEIQAPVDTFRLAASGGLRKRRWDGRIEAIDVLTAAAGDWHLAEATPVAVSATEARIQPLCVLADSAGGRACGEGVWRAGGIWNVSATVERVPVAGLTVLALDRFAGGREAFSGTLGARLEARSNGTRMDATLRATSDTVTFAYREGSDTAARTLALDSAVVDVRADRNGLVATLGLRVVDDEKAEVATLNGRAAMPTYRIGRPLGGVAMDVRLEGRVPDVGFARPLFTRVDSLRGAMTLDLVMGGIVRAPRVDGALRLQDFMAGVTGANKVDGSAELIVRGEVGGDRSLAGEARLTPAQVRYAYRRFGVWRQVTLDSGGVRIVAGPNGVEANLQVAAIGPDSSRVGTLVMDGALPGYRRWGQPLGHEPVRLTARADLPDLDVFEPLVAQLDSLDGRLDLDLEVEGRVATPTIRGTFVVDSGSGRLPYGTWVRGGLGADLRVAVARDSTLQGSFRVEPRNVRLEYSESGAPAIVRLDETELVVRAGGGGVHGTLDVTLADSGGTALGTVRGRMQLPRYTRVGRPLGPQPLEATFEGRIDDLSFIKAFTAQVDSAAGRITLDARLAGTIGESHLVGGFDMRDVAAHLPLLGILLEDVQFTARGDQRGAIAFRGTMKSGGGDLTLTGNTPVQPSDRNPGRVQVRGSLFEAVANGQVHAVITPRLDVTITDDLLAVRGDVNIPLARVVLTEIPEFAVPPSDDIILLDSVEMQRGRRALAARVRIVLGDSVSFSGFNFNAEFGGSLTVNQAPDALATGTGTLFIEEGRYRAYGQDLTIERGAFRFVGGPVDNPGLSIRARRTAEDSTVAGIAIGGTLKAPTVTLFSNPPMSQSQVLSYIVRGQPLGGGGGSSGNLLSKALTSLGLRGGNVLVSEMGDEFGLDDARIETEGKFREASFVAGRYLSPNLYVSYGIGLFDPISTLRLRYLLSNRFTLLAETGRETSADVLMKTKER